ncbi:MAG TPA: dihydroorotate dehydrogenase [Candidatus Eremiobacteraceae bacterium]|nr:dihydroorotate dehydrogenase [Candidatus Eremiobacteraceae bacterium]
MTAADALDLRFNIGSAVLKNPVIAASGCYNRGAEYARIVDVGEYGAITLKSITKNPRLGNGMPRIASTPAGMLNAIGLQGPGIEYFLEHEAPKLPSVPTAVIASVAGFSVDEFAFVASRMDGLPNVIALELDVSCPNVDREGQCFAAEPSTIAAVVSAVKRRVKLPVIAKLMPNVADLKPIAKAAQEAGADALSLINAVRGMVIDVKAARPMLANFSGGLSGPAIRPIAVHAVWEVAQVATIPLIGMGGIENGSDALEFLFAGAGGIAIGTANFRNPAVHLEVLESIARELRARNLSSIRSLTGLARAPFATTHPHVKERH